MSVSIVSAEGLQVVLQVFPKNEKPPEAPPQAPTSVTVQTAGEPPKTSRFPPGQLKRHGVVQILVGALTLWLGIGLLVTDHTPLMAPLWTGSAYIVSGALALVTAYKHTNIALLRYAIGVHVACALVAVAGAATFCVTLAALKVGRKCYEEMPQYSRVRIQCESLTRRFLVGRYGVSGLLLVLAVLQFCVTVVVSVFCTRTIRSRTKGQEERAQVKELEVFIAPTEPSGSSPLSEDKTSSSLSSGDLGEGP